LVLFGLALHGRQGLPVRLPVPGHCNPPVCVASADQTVVVVEAKQVTQRRIGESSRISGGFEGLHARPQRAIRVMLLLIMDVRSHS
jgi:hypothetical protein